jgi:hypothetical protein
MRTALIAKLVVLCAMVACIGIRGALADSKPPHYDPTVYCEDFWKGEKGDVNLCVEGEQSAYNNLKEEWDGIPDPMKMSCDEVAKSWHGKGSYVGFYRCILNQRATETTKSP